MLERHLAVAKCATVKKSDADSRAARGNHCFVGNMKIDLVAEKGRLAAAKKTAVYQYGLRDSTIAIRLGT